MPRVYRFLLLLIPVVVLTYCAASLAPDERRIALADLQDR